MNFEIPENEAIYICKDYDPKLCDVQCKLVVRPWTMIELDSCVNGGGSVTWKLCETDKELSEYKKLCKIE